MTGHAGGPLLAGVDVGGTKAEALVVDFEGALVGRALRPMKRTAAAASLEPVVAAVRAALRAGGAIPADLAAVGVGVPGRVDREAGIVTVAANLGWRDVPLASVLERELAAPCRIENDVRLAADGLIGHPAAGKARSLAYVAVGTGIGAGLVLDCSVYRGPRGTAGEIGHVIVEPDGVECSCGQRGCLETVASGPAILRRAEAALVAGEPSLLQAARPETARDVYDAARAGDRLALAVVDRGGRALARAILSLVLTCDLERVLVGGGVAAAGAVFFDPIVAELERLRAASPFVAQLLRADTVCLLPAGFDAVAWGGVAVARRMATLTEIVSLDRSVAVDPIAEGDRAAAGHLIATGEPENDQHAVRNGHGTALEEEVVAREADN